MAKSAGWNAARYKAFYDAYYQELLAAGVIKRWQKIDLSISLLVALTVSGSAFSGLAWWSTDWGKPIWGILATVASIAAIVHSVARVATHLQQQGEARRDFSLLRGNLQYVLYQMQNTEDDAELKKLEIKFESLNTKLVELTAKLEPDIAATLSLREKTQKDLEILLRQLGIIPDGGDSGK
jgi:hypothetical protein